MNVDAVMKRLENRIAELGTSAQAISLQATDKKDTVRNWIRKHREGAQFSMRQDNLEAVAAALDVSLNWLITGEDDGVTPAGFSEETTLFTPRPDEEQAIASLFAAKAKHPQCGRRSQVDMPELGISINDLIVIDLGREPQIGDLVMVTVEDMKSDAKTVIRRYFPPYLLTMQADTDMLPMREDEPGVCVRYPVIGLIRGT